MQRVLGIRQASAAERGGCGADVLRHYGLLLEVADEAVAGTW